MSVISPLAYRGYSANFSSISDSVKLAIDDGLLVVFTAQRYASAVYAMASVCVFACVCVCVCMSQAGVLSKWLQLYGLLLRKGHHTIAQGL